MGKDNHSKDRLNRRSILKTTATGLLGVAGVGKAAAKRDLVEDTGTAQVSDVSVTVSEEKIGPDATTTITLETSENVAELRVEGDTSGWTIESMEPLASIIGNPTSADSFPYESGDEDWFYADSNLASLTIDVSATVSKGQYSFTAKALNEQSEVVAENSFTIEVTEGGIELTIGGDLDPSNRTTSVGIWEESNYSEDENGQPNTGDAMTIKDTDQQGVVNFTGLAIGADSNNPETYVAAAGVNDEIFGVNNETYELYKPDQLNVTDTLTVEYNTKPTVDVSPGTVGTDSATTVTVGTDSEVALLQVQGDTQNWTITDMQPTATFIGNPTSEDGFPYQSGDEDWFYADNPTGQLEIDLEATVQTGTFNFTAVAENDQNELLGETSFEIEVTDQQSPIDGITPAKFNAALPNGASTTVAELRTSIQEWTNGQEIDGVPVKLTELRQIIQWWVDNQ